MSSSKGTPEGEKLLQDIIELQKNNLTDNKPIIDYLQKNHPDFFEPNRYAHYIHLGTPGEKILQPIKSWEITPEIWKNKSRAHTNKYSKKLSGLKYGREVVQEQPADDIESDMSRELGSSFQRGGTVSEVWQQVTGTPWAQAKAQGLTDGSYDANINLRKQLLANPEQFKQKQTPAHDLTPANTPNNASNTTLSPEEINDKINQAKDFSSAFKLARDYYGPNKIFSYKNKQFGTNLKGETFQPSEEDMITAGLNLKQREAIQQQNRLVVSPYTTTNSVEFDQFEDIEKVKKNTKALNKLNQVDLIVSYQLTHAKDPYLIVDEKMGRMHLYYPGQTEPTESYPILSGTNTGDAQTVTKADYFYKGEKLDQAGLNEAMRSTGVKSIDQLMKQPGYSSKINWSAGNKTTGAGKFTIGIVNEDSGFFDESGRGRKTPSFVLRNEQGDDVSTVIHTVPSRKSASRINALANFDPENTRMTNGCINGRCSDLIDMNKIHNVGMGTQVFILPEDEGNQFVFENGQLNFKVKSGKDYNTYIDSEGNVQRGQGINRSRNTLNYRPIQIEVDKEQFQNDKFKYWDFNDEDEYKNVVAPYVKSLEDNKQKIMKVMQVNGDVYNEIAKVSFGILGNESNFGDTHSAVGNLARAARKWRSPTTSSSPDYKSKFNTYKAQSDDNSVGLTQFRWKWVEEDAKQGGDLKERLATLGITSNRDFLDAEKAALATTAILAYYYNNRKVDDIMNDLPKYYAGITEKDPNREVYTKNVKNNAKYLIIKEKQYQDGGEIHKELFNIYKNYINGMYDDTPYFKEGGKVYDKFNRVYYSKAKAKGMSSPNYIMSHIISC